MRYTTTDIFLFVDKRPLKAFVEPGCIDEVHEAELVREIADGEDESSHEEQRVDEAVDSGDEGRHFVNAKVDRLVGW